MKPFFDQLFPENRPAILAAPLAGVTDAAYQQILHECEAPVVSTEMIPTASIARCPKAAHKLMRWHTDIHPVNAQLYGYSVDHFLKTLDVVEQFQPEIVDINMGCPAKKIYRNGAGVALMGDLDRAREIVRGVRKQRSGLLSIKIRLGVDRGDFSGLDFGKMAQDEGVDFITVHGRYRTSYSVPAEWDKIGEIKSALSIPVIGNGDILTVEDAGRMIQETGCDGVMIARGILGNPWLPKRIEGYFLTGEIPPEPDLKERFQVFSRHLEYLIDVLDERRAGLVFRKHAAWYLKGFPNVSVFRRKLFTFSRPEQFYGAVKELLETYGCSSSQ